MEQKKIDLGNAELAQAIVHGTLEVAVCHEIGPDLGGDEEPITWQAGGDDPVANEFLVGIALGSIDMPVAFTQSGLHDLGAVLAAQPPRAKANLRDSGSRSAQRSAVGGLSRHLCIIPSDQDRAVLPTLSILAALFHQTR